MSKLLILDKDGTLIKTRSGETFVNSPEDQELIPGVAEALSRYSLDGWTMAIATNQGGVASGFKSLNSALDEVIFAMRLTHIEFAMMAHTYEPEVGEAVFVDTSDNGLFWKPVTNGRLRFRKPAGGMIEFLATRMFGVRWRETVEVLYVGDRPEDQQAAENTGVAFMWDYLWRSDAAK